jgi:hypothetical protein
VTARGAAIKGREDTLFWQGILSIVMLFRWLRAHPLTTTHQLHHREFFHCYAQFFSFVRKADCVRAPKSLSLGGEGTSGLFLQRAPVSLIHQPETIGDPYVLCSMFVVYFYCFIRFQLILDCSSFCFL